MLATTYACTLVTHAMCLTHAGHVQMLLLLLPLSGGDHRTVVPWPSYQGMLLAVAASPSGDALAVAGVPQENLPPVPRRPAVAAGAVAATELECEAGSSGGSSIAAVARAAARGGARRRVRQPVPLLARQGQGGRASGDRDDAVDVPSEPGGSGGLGGAVAGAVAELGVRDKGGDPGNPAGAISRLHLGASGVGCGEEGRGGMFDEPSGIMAKSSRPTLPAQGAAAGGKAPDVAGTGYLSMPHVSSTPGASLRAPIFIWRMGQAAAGLGL